MSGAPSRPATRKRLDDELLVSLCNGTTCGTIFRVLGESQNVVLRHLRDLVRRKRLVAERRGLRVFYTRVQS